MLVSSILFMLFFEPKSVRRMNTDSHTTIFKCTRVRCPYFEATAKGFMFVHIVVFRSLLPLPVFNSRSSSTYKVDEDFKSDCAVRASTEEWRPQLLFIPDLMGYSLKVSATERVTLTSKRL